MQSNFALKMGTYVTLKSQLEKATNNPEKNCHFNSSKNSTPCPFHTRRGWCVKGNRCDFKHPEPLRNDQKHLVPCPFLQRKGCLKENRCDFSHDGFSNNITTPKPELTSFFTLPGKTTIPLELMQRVIMNEQCPCPNHHQGPSLPQPWLKPLMEVQTHPPFPCRIWPTNPPIPTLLMFLTQ